MQVRVSSGSVSVTQIGSKVIIHHSPFASFCITADRGQRLIRCKDLEGPAERSWWRRQIRKLRAIRRGTYEIQSTVTHGGER